MMGSKARVCEPISMATLEELVPPDHFYRHLEFCLDLSFVRELVADCYAAGGRPSIDPIVFFKLQLVLFFEGLRSERELVRVAADRLSVAGTSATTWARRCPRPNGAPEAPQPCPQPRDPFWSCPSLA